jgi:CubicO group peptidase (beta-lactamase class C family)
MRKDAIFRIYSMSKPITTTIAMLLVEQGRLRLSDPVQKYLPEFKDVKVGEEKPDKTLELVAPRRPVTGQDLMRHTSGLTYGFFGEGAEKKAYLEANLAAGDPSTAEVVARLAKLPLVYQPGTTWDYSHATDVLGRLVEGVAGKPLSAALREMLFDPLGTTDTSFYLEDQKKYPRLAEPLAGDRSIGAGAALNDPRQVLNYESGGGGLLSTAAASSSLCDNAGQRRGARRQALLEPQGRRLHDLRPYGRRDQAWPL